MVHLAPLPPWRRRAQRIVGILLAALGVVVLVIAIIALRQPNGHQAAIKTSGVAGSSLATSVSSSASTRAPTSSAPPTSAHPSSSTPAPTSSKPVVNLKAVPLIVLNNTNQTGLADTVASTLRSGGWTVTRAGNLDNNILSTCAYYDPAVPNAEAAAMALQVQFPAIKRVKEKFAELPAGPIVVVLTSDYS